MVFDESEIEHAIAWGAEQIRQKLYSKNIYQTTSRNREFQIPCDDFYPGAGVVGGFSGAVPGLEIADGNLDGVVTKEDINCWEQTPNGTRIYINSDVVSVDIDRHIVVFSSQHPVGNNTLFFEYWLTYRKIAEMKEQLRRLNILYSANYLLRNVPIKKLQRGIGSWTINNVSVEFQSSSLQDIIKSNQEEINRILDEITRAFIKTTQIRRPAVRGTEFLRSTLRWS